jgi:large subunit ribosomal protein L29
MYKAKDLRERSADDLRELERSLSKELFGSRFKNFTNRLDDTSSMRKYRRDLARVKTVLAELARAGKLPAAKEKTEAKAAPKAAAAPKKEEAPKAEAAAPAAESPVLSDPDQAPKKPVKKPRAKKAEKES